MTGSMNHESGLQSLAHERAAREELEARLRENDELIATLAHDLRTPLNTMIGWIQLLRSGAARDPRLLAEGLEVVERSARLQARRIAEFADASRLASGRTKLALQPLGLRAIVEAAVASLERAVQVEPRIPAEDPRLEADPERLPRAIAALITRVAERAGGSPVGLQADVRRGRLEILVSCASAEGDVPSATGTGRAEGLETFFVRSVLEVHRGALRAEGASFVVTLPLAETFAST